MPGMKRTRGKGDGSYTKPMKRQPVTAAKGNPTSVTALGKTRGNRKIY